MRSEINSERAAEILNGMVCPDGGSQFQRYSTDEERIACIKNCGKCVGSIDLENVTIVYEAEKKNETKS